MPSPVSGILDLDSRGFAFVRSLSLTLAHGKSDPFLPPTLIKKFNLRTGVFIEGEATERKGKSPEVHALHAVNGLSPEKWKTLVEFSQLLPIAPDEHIRLEASSASGRSPLGHKSMRIVDLFCPIGRGQRGLIVSPPKAGKTMLVQHLAHAISVNNPEIDLLVLLIDERPEEVTDIQRTVKGQVFASSSDSERGWHVRLAQLVLEYARRKVEAGQDVVLLLDSLTRMGRAFNIHQKSSGRTMSGGVDIRALEIPKRIFGAARNLENGGSLTIIATALIETGSRMDELIFQEFKGTGNMEVVLDRDLANERIYPSINLNLSGTRREELLFGSAVGQHQALRRSIARLSPRDAMLTVLKLVEQYPTNGQLLAKF